jgi:hypothetical protein
MVTSLIRGEAKLLMQGARVKKTKLILVSLTDFYANVVPMFSPQLLVLRAS